MIHRYLLSYHLPPKGVLLLLEGGELSYYYYKLLLLIVRFMFILFNTDNKRINTDNKRINTDKNEQKLYRIHFKYVHQTSDEITSSV